MSAAHVSWLPRSTQGIPRVRMDGARLPLALLVVPTRSRLYLTVEKRPAQAGSNLPKRPTARSDVAPLGDMHRVGERPHGARPAGSTPRRAPSRLSNGLRATGAATLRLELPAELRLLPPISGCSQRRSSEDRSNHGNPADRRLAAMMRLSAQSGAGLLSRHETSGRQNAPLGETVGASGRLSRLSR